jgi:hypothetical protein
LFVTKYRYAVPGTGMLINFVHTGYGIQLCCFSFGMAYFGIALHTPEFGSNVYMVFFLGALSELPMTFVGK